MSDRPWEYCNVRVTTLREGTGEVFEQIEVVLPGDRVEKKSGHGTGVVSLLNELGADGWEVFEMGTSIWLKRKMRSAKSRHPDTHAKSGITDVDGDGD